MEGGTTRDGCFAFFTFCVSCFLYSATMKTILLIIFPIVFSTSLAQDYHHWSEHFGARASLLGGAATSGLGDNATVYYNPAAMAFVEDPSLSISVNAYRIRMLKIENALGEGLDLEETQFNSMPNLIAGIMAFEKRPKLRLGYAVLTRRSFGSKFDFLHEAYQEILPQFNGAERWVYSYNMHHELMEYWAGLGLSYQLSKSFSIGLSHFGIYRDVKYSYSHALNILPQDFSGLEVYQAANVESFNYYNVKGVFKPSIALNLENFRLGLAFTTPSFNMFGKAKAYREISYINFADITDDIDVDIQIIDRIDNLKAVHKEHGALAIGLSWKMGKRAWFHLTHETFFGGKRYYIFNSDEKPSIYPDVLTEQQMKDILLGGENFISLTEETEARTNLGLGLEIKMAKRWDLYLGARTDFLYNEVTANRPNTMHIESSKWQLVHFSLGLVHWNKKDKRYTVGLEYGASPLNFANLGEGKTRSNSFKLIVEIEVGKPKENQ